MILSEEHAKNTICPMLSMGTEKKAFCQTKNCMMWIYSNANAQNPKGFCGLVAGYASLMKEEDFRMYE
ncbi:MAG: hypothetical protein OHK006_24440 [Thermodesulfovibrionales bacterium]